MRKCVSESYDSKAGVCVQVQKEDASLASNDFYFLHDYVHSQESSM